MPREIRYTSDRPLRSLYHLLGASFRWYLGMFLLLAMKNSPVLLAPVMLAAFVDSLKSPEPSLSHLWLWFIIYVVMWLQNIPSHMLFIRLLANRLRGFEFRLRGHLIERIQQLSINYFSERETGALQAKILRDVENIEQLCQILIQQGFHVLLTLGVISVLVAIQAPLLLILMACLLPLCVLLVSFFKGRVRRRNEAFRARLESMNSRVSEMVNMITVTRAHGLEEVEIERVNSRLGEVRHHGVRLDTINAIFSASSTCTVFLTQGILLLVMGWMSFHGLISIAEVVLYQGLYAQAVSGVMALLQMYPNMAKGIESVRSLGDVFECPCIENNQGKRTVEGIRGSIRFENVHFRYPGKETNAVEGVSFEASAGQCTAFVGASGSGKSTLMNLIIGFWPPREGMIYLDDHPMTELDLRSFRRHLAVVPQHTVLLAGSMRDNITYGLEAVDEKAIAEAVKAANLDELIADLPDGLDTQVGENGLALSGGQRQRLAIARAIIRDPRVIILDEATSALDVESEQLVQEAINHLIAGRTTFIVAHRLSTIRRAHTIHVMKEGRIVESGSPEALSAGDTHFSRMRALQL